MKNKINFTPFILLAVMILSIAGYFFFAGRYRADLSISSVPSAVNFWGYFISSFLTMELVAFHIVPPFSALLLFLVSRNKNFLNSLWFCEHSWEKTFYDFIKVKQWKTRVGTYDKKLFAGKNFSKEKLVMTITQSELVHEIVFILSFCPVCLTKTFGHLPLLVVLCTIFAAANLPFIFIQRYNRPRVLKMQERKPK